MNTIHEVMEYGYVVASDSELDILITVNGAYFNIWRGDFDGHYSNTDCKSTGFDKGLYGQDMAKVIDKASDILEEISSMCEEEQDDE